MPASALGSAGRSAEGVSSSGSSLRLELVGDEVVEAEDEEVIVVGDLEEVTTVEGRACHRAPFDRPDDRATLRIEGVQPLARGEPDAAAVEGDARHLVDAGEGAVFLNDLCGLRFHVTVLAMGCGGEGCDDPYLATGQRRRE